MNGNSPIVELSVSHSFYKKKWPDCSSHFLNNIVLLQVQQLSEYHVDGIIEDDKDH